MDNSVPKLPLRHCGSTKWVCHWVKLSGTNDTNFCAALHIAGCTLINLTIYAVIVVVSHCWPECNGNSLSSCTETFFVFHILLCFGLL